MEIVRRSVVTPCPHCDTPGPKQLTTRRTVLPRSTPPAAALCPNCHRTFDPFAKRPLRTLLRYFEHVFL